MVELSQMMEPVETLEIPANTGSETRVLRSKLLNLVLDWELEALALDAKRYKTEVRAEREALRHDASLYRKCIADLTGILGAQCTSR